MIIRRALWLTLLALFIDMILSADSSWFKVIVEKSIIDSGTRLNIETVSISNTNKMYLIQILALVDLSTLGCILSTTELLVTAGKVSPFYKNATQDSYICFTNLPKDLVFGAFLDGSKTYSLNHEMMTEQNLAKGLSTGVFSPQCLYYTTTSDAPWILVDFGQAKAFDTVVLQTVTSILIHFSTPSQARFGTAILQPLQVTIPASTSLTRSLTSLNLDK